MVMNSGHIDMMAPFIASLQMQIVPMMGLNIHRDEDLDKAGGLLYAISTADIIPDFLLIPIRKLIFGTFDENDQLVPDFYDILGYDSRNFIVCTGSILLFFTLQLILLIFGEIIGCVFGFSFCLR